MERGCQRESGLQQKGEAQFGFKKTFSDIPTCSFLGDNSRSLKAPSLNVPGQSVWTAPLAYGSPHPLLSMTGR